MTNADAKTSSPPLSRPTANIHISLSGQSISNSERASVGASMAVGLLAALAIMLLIFGGALFSALMPLLATIVALVIGISVVGLLTHVFDIASESTDLAVLIGSVWAWTTGCSSSAATAVG